MSIYIDSVLIRCSDSTIDPRLTQNCRKGDNYLKQAQELKEKYKNEAKSESSNIPSRDLWSRETFIQAAKYSSNRPGLLCDRTQEKVDGLFTKIRRDGPFAKYYFNIGQEYAVSRDLDNMKIYFDSARTVCGSNDIENKYLQDCDVILVKIKQIINFIEYQVKLEHQRKSRNDDD